MTGLIFLISISIFLMLLIWAIRTPSRWETLVQTAAKDGRLDPLLEELDRRPLMLQPKFYNEAMAILIQSDIDVATQLSIVFVPRYPEDRHCQHWLRVLREMEPRSPLLTSAFLDQHHRANCSPAGG